MQKRIIALTAAALLASATSALATIDLQFELVSVVPMPAGEYKWTYRTQLQPDTNLRSNATVNSTTVSANDFVTLHDILGYVPGTAAFASSAPYANTTNPTATFTFGVTVQNLGLTPQSILPDDLADVPNITVKLLSGTVATIIPDGTSPVNLGELSYHSIYPFTADHFSDFSSQTQKATDLTTDRQIGQVETPAIPEPAALGFLPVVAGLLGRRRR